MMDAKTIKAKIEELTSILKIAFFDELDDRMVTACIGGTVDGVSYGRDPILDMTHAELWKACELHEGNTEDRDKPLGTRFSAPTIELEQFRKEIDGGRSVEGINEALCNLLCGLGKYSTPEKNANKVLDAIRAIAKPFELYY